MRDLIIQFQPQRYPELGEAQAEDLFKSFATSSPPVTDHTIAHDEDGGAYLNFTMSTSDPASLWKSVQEELYQNSSHSAGLRSSTIVICQGEHGWDDYLLLHSFVEGETLDSLDANTV